MSSVSPEAQQTQDHMPAWGGDEPSHSMQAIEGCTSWWRGASCVGDGSSPPAHPRQDRRCRRPRRRDVDDLFSATRVPT
jgi:hypothetical protein